MATEGRDALSHSLVTDMLIETYMHTGGLATAQGVLFRNRGTLAHVPHKVTGGDLSR